MILKKNFFKISFLLVLLIKISSVIYLDVKRELPVEPDDMLVYSYQASSIYESTNSVKNNKKIFKDKINQTFKNSTDEQEKIIIQKINFRFNQNLFPIYSVIMGFFISVLKFQATSVLWASNYFFQVLLSYVFIKFSKKYSNSYIEFFIILVLLLSTSIHFHQYYFPTPFVISVILFLLSFLRLIEKNLNYKKKTINFILLILSFGIHPGGIIFNFIIMFYLLTETFLFKNKNFDHILKFLFFTSLIFIIFALIFYLIFKIDITNLFYENLYEREIFNLSSYVTNAYYAFVKFYHLYESLSLLNNFTFGLLLHSLSLFFLYKKKTFWLLRLIIIFYFFSFLSILHLLPNQYGDIAERIHVMMYFFMCIPIGLFLSFLLDKFLKKNILISFFILIIFLFNFSQNFNVLKIRANKDNYHNEFENIKSSISNIDMEKAILIGDFFTLHIVLNITKDHVIKLNNRNFFIGQKQDISWTDNEIDIDNFFYIGKPEKFIKHNDKIIFLNKENSYFTNY